MPLYSSVEGILLRVSCIFVADGAKTEAASRGFARSGALGLPGAGHVLLPVWASRLGEALAKTEDLSKPEWCF